MTPQEQDLCVKFDIDYYYKHYGDHLTDEEFLECKKISSQRWPLNKKQLAFAMKIKERIHPIERADTKRIIDLAQAEKERMSKFLDKP